MASNTLTMSFFIVFALFTLLINCHSSEAQMVQAVYVFGDSLLDVGNNNHLPVSIAKANFPHHGIDFPTKKPTGRFCNGKNSADFVAEKVGLPTSPPYLSLPRKNASSSITGISFASAGAGIFNGTDLALGQSLPLTQQVGYYESVYEELVQKMGPSGAQSHLSKSLVAIVIGSNDLLDYFASSNLRKKSTPQQYVGLMALTLKGLIKRIYACGARNFLFSGVGPLGCLPFQRVKNETEECNSDINSVAVAYNQVLMSMLQELKSELKGMSYSYFDTYNVMQNMIQNPSSYGFNEVKAACCGLGELRAKFPCSPIAAYCFNRSDHVFWDPAHPTEAAAKILVNTLFDGSSHYTYPINLRQLVTS